MIDQADLADMRAAQLVSFVDACQIAPVVETQDDAGQLVQSWPAYGDEIACGFRATGGDERALRVYSSGAIVVADAILRLPLGTAIAAKSRVKITRIAGEELDTPLEFGVLGPPRRGRTALVVDLEEIR